MIHSTRRTTRAVGLLLAAALALVGCSRDDRPDSTEAAETYTVEHEFGSTDVPIDYQRVVVTQTSLMDSSVAVDVVPVGAPLSHTGVPAYMGIDAGAVSAVAASEEEIDPEVVSELDPDLILINVGPENDAETTNYEAFSAIAPTIPILTGRQDPKDVAEQVARALNRVDEMQEQAANYEARAVELRAALAVTPAAALPVSQVRLRPDHARVMMADTNAGVAMTEVGLTFREPLPGAEISSGGYYEASLELLPEALGDHIFVYSTDEGVLENVRTLPIWQEIPAVTAGNEHDVDFEVWMRGQGYLALNRILDDIAAAYGVPAPTGTA